MSEKLKRCKACEETFVWNEDVILVNDEAKIAYNFTQ